MERGCVGKVRRDRPELCESSTESRRPGTRRPVELITREMGTPAEERAGKEVLAPALGSTRLPKQGPHPRAMARGPACLVRLHPFPHLLFPRPRNAGWDEERGGVATVRGPETQFPHRIRMGLSFILEREMATHSSMLACKIPWTEGPGRLQSTGSQRVGHNEQ